MTSSVERTTRASIPSTSSINVNLIYRPCRYFPAPTDPVAFSDGNIMLGGGGSDFIEGRGGNDIIDGDARLHVELTRDANGHIFAGSQIVREILTDQAVGPTFGPTIDPFTGEEVFDLSPLATSIPPCWRRLGGHTDQLPRMPKAIFSWV